MVSTVAATVTANAVRKPLEDIYSSCKEGMRRKLRAITTDSKLRDIQKSIKSVQKVKTMWRIDKEVPLTSFYYPSKVILGKNRKQISSIAEISKTENFVIQGTVGQGKSIFLRYLCIKELAASERVPVFLELRRYKPGTSFTQFLISGISLLGIPCDSDVFEHLANSGKVVLLLDAFDEVEQEAVTEVLSELEVLVQKYQGLDPAPVFRRPG